MLPSSAELMYFYEVATCLSISKASLKLNISQPTLSLAIKRIEQTMGTSLFIRHKQGVTLMPAGKKLLTQVKILLQQWKDLRTQAISSHQEIQGEMILGCPSPIGLYLHAIMGNLFEAYPELSIHVQHDTSLTITEKVINSTIDIGIVTNPMQHPDLIINKIGKTEVTFWHGFENKKIQDVQSDRAVIICDTNIPHTHYLLKKWKKLNSKSMRIINVNRLETIAHLTANNCGIGILPACFIKFLYPEKLQHVPDSPICYDDIYLIYRAENKNVKALQMIAQTIKNLVCK
jgi:DNA-binding transcriptional LysR family regulator